MNQEVFEKLQYTTLKEQVEAYCVSNLGKKRVQALTPSPSKKVVAHRLAETEEARKLLDITGGIPLQGTTQIDDILDKVEKDIILNPEQLAQVVLFLRGCRKIQTYMKDKERETPILYGYSLSIMSFQAIEEEIDACIRNNQISDEASKVLKKIRHHMHIAESKIEEKLNQFLKHANNKPYIQDFFVSRRHGKLTIPIKAAYKSKVAGIVIESTDKTVFMELNSVSKHSAEVLNLQIEASMEEYKILSALTHLVYEQKEAIKSNFEVISQYDMIQAKGKYSRRIEGQTPQLNTKGLIAIEQGKHPLLEGDVVPLDVQIGDGYRSLIITGPNAGGKTVVLKTVGLLTLAMQSGIQVPVAKSSHMAVFEKVFVDIGDNQSLENSLSTFSSHVKNLSTIINQTNQRTLLLFDEIGSGTEPSEGAALAIAILEKLYHKGAITIATTHYNEIKNFSTQHPDFENAAMQFNSETLEPLYRLLIGKSGESNALWIARKMGIQSDILKKARQYMTAKDYDLSYVSEEKTRDKALQQESISQSSVTYAKGDKVLLLEYNEEAIVYTPKTLYDPLVVYYKDAMHRVDERRVKLLLRASDLYPADYDLDALFIDFKTRKRAHDIERGSKKALKKIRRGE